MAYYDVMRDADFEMLIKLNKTKSRVILYHKYKISYPISAYHYIDESQMDDYMVEGAIGEMRPSKNSHDINQPPPLPRARNSTKDACLPVAEQRVVIDLGDDGYEVPSLHMFANPEESETIGSNVTPGPNLACAEDENVSCDRLLQSLSMTRNKTNWAQRRKSFEYSRARIMCKWVTLTEYNQIRMKGKRTALFLTVDV